MQHGIPVKICIPLNGKEIADQPCGDYRVVLFVSRASRSEARYLAEAARPRFECARVYPLAAAIETRARKVRGNRI